MLHIEQQPGQDQIKDCGRNSYLTLTSHDLKFCRLFIVLEANCIQSHYPIAKSSFHQNTNALSFNSDQLLFELHRTSDRVDTLFAACLPLIRRLSKHRTCYLVSGRAQPRFMSVGLSLLSTKDRASTVGVITELR